MQFTLPQTARCLLLMLLVFSIAGCGPSAPSPGTTEADAPGLPAASSDEADHGDPQLSDPPSAASAGDENSDVTVRTANIEQYQGLLAESQGQVVLVDFWATWCPPCKAQFPHTVKLGKQHQQDGLRVISVSFDDPEASDDVLKFLKKQDATIVNLISEYGSGVKSPEEFAIEGGAVPFYKLYDRQGTLRHQFSGDPDGITGTEPIDTIDARLNELLAENP